ncbi:hypothetical protein [Natranaerobius thermophilus]|nr:hypothetical protein [Natranaerobius thermophilus]
MGKSMRFSKFHYFILGVGILAILTSSYGIISTLVAGTYSFGEYDYGILIGVLLILYYFKGDNTNSRKSPPGEENSQRK